MNSNMMNYPGMNNNKINFQNNNMQGNFNNNNNPNINNFNNNNMNINNKMNNNNMNMNNNNMNMNNNNMNMNNNNMNINNNNMNINNKNMNMNNNNMNMNNNNMNINNKMNMNNNMFNNNLNINNNMNNNNRNNNIGNVNNNKMPNNFMVNSAMNMRVNNPINNSIMNNMGNVPMMNNMNLNVGNNINPNNAMNKGIKNINNNMFNAPKNVNVNQNFNNTNNNANNNMNSFHINMNIIGNNLGNNIKMNQNNMNNMNNNNFNNNPSFQFMQNFGFGGFKVDFSSFNNMNNNKKVFKDINEIMKNKEAEAFANEIDIISNKLDTIFSQDELAKLMNEEDLLRYFSQKEGELLQFIEENFGGQPFLKNYTSDEIKRIFNDNPVINHISILINVKIQNMDLTQMKSEKDFNSKIKKQFKGIKLPKFLIEPSLKELNAILFYSNRKEATTTIINNINNKKSSNSSILLNMQLEKIRQNINFFLEGINCRYELIYLFLILNNLELKGRIWQKLFNYFLINESTVKYYFSQNFSHTQIFQQINTMNEQQLRDKIENLYLIIDLNVGNNENIIHSIIASFYYFLFYGMKTSQNSTDFCNIGDTILNVSLKTFVIFLDTKLKNKFNLAENLYELLKQLYIYDVNYLVTLNTVYSPRTSLINFEFIDSVLSSNVRVKDAYDDLKEKYQPKEGEGLFTKIQKGLHLGEGRDFSTFEKYIKLIPCDEFVFTNTITIIIDGFTTEEDNPMDKWKDFVHHFNRESMFYFYKWPSDSSSNIISRGIKNALRFGSQNFSSASERAKICGKILAYIIYSNEIFKNFQINLVGFSLGNHVIKYCIKELYKLNQLNQDSSKEILLKNVILSAAATTIKHKENWITYLKTLITDKLKNCYSQKDDVLRILYGLCMMKTAIGRNELILCDENNKNLVENYNFTQYNYGHLSYNMGVVAKDISGYYKEL